VHIGYLKSLGLEFGYGPTSLIEWTLEHIHVLAGTPWWASIILTAIAVRATLFYTMIGSADNAARLATIKHITQPIYDKMKAASARSDSAETMKLRGELQLIQKRAGINLIKSFLPLIQVPLGFGTFFLLRAMARLPVPGLETGGILWFPNLALPDPTFLLPIATAGILHWVLRVRLLRP
jgi:YidC/Oxa1 family membrane protein insertase